MADLLVLLQLIAEKRRKKPNQDSNLGPLVLRSDALTATPQLRTNCHVISPVSMTREITARISLMRSFNSDCEIILGSLDSINSESESGMKKGPDSGEEFDSSSKVHFSVEAKFLLFNDNLYIIIIIIIIIIHTIAQVKFAVRRAVLVQERGPSSPIIYRIRAVTSGCGDDNNALSESAMRISYKICHEIAKELKTFSEGEFIKRCLIILADELCPQQVEEVEAIRLSRRTVVRRLQYMRMGCDHKGRIRGPQVVRGPQFGKRCYTKSIDISLYCTGQ
ncbi:hypothetical protein ANN_13290 [Periplaneta americana]|uniref:Uncharacterized protein n=1 Tax=Periplaneta americana TaxID=6978 RepID=A0ABQ8TJ05_PERAM|nr:hypothetical protein ANN_13290 [Periplaneta americana]